MARYIDASKLMRRIETEAMRWGEEYDLSQIMGDIEDFPTADVAEVKHGKWIEQVRWIREDRTVMHYQCSLCDVYTAKELNYCPNCGAKMDGGDAK